MRIAIIVMLALMVASFASAADSGLVVPRGTKVYVLVEDINDSANKIGLTEELIINKVELQLRRNGVPVGTKADSLVDRMYLYVNCGFTGPAFAINIDFKRQVFYLVGDKLHSVTASTYHRGGQGTHGSDRGHVIKVLTDLIDEFSNDFLKSN